MVNAVEKAPTRRRAVACASIHLKPDTFKALERGTTKKGDVLATARIAGTQAAKRTFELLPLCHALALAGVELELLPDPERGIVAVTATAQATGSSGVKMEALVAATVAALTLYHMLKSIDREMTITDIELVEKTGEHSEPHISGLVDRPTRCW